MFLPKAFISCETSSAKTSSLLKITLAAFNSEYVPEENVSNFRTKRYFYTSMTDVPIPMLWIRVLVQFNAGNSKILLTNSNIKCYGIIDNYPKWRT